MHYTFRLNIGVLRRFLVKFFLFLLIFSFGYFVGSRHYGINKNNFFDLKIDRSLPSGKEDIDFSLFWKVWDTLASSYYDKSKLDPVKMVQGAIQGMVASIGDPYTVYLPPDENKIVREDLEGTFGGVGIQIGFKGKQLAVIAPLPNTPAEKAGIKAGDFILAIKDEKKGVDVSTAGMSLHEAVKLIRGKAGTEVILTLLRDNEEKPREVKVVRDDIVVPSVVLSFEGESKDIAHLRLLKFGGETDEEWKKAVSKILSNSVTQIVLDLRDNPGGYLQGAVDIAGDFLDRGTVAVYEETGGNKTEIKTDRIPRFSSYKVVVLVNGGSASASEILAGALRDQAKIKIVGEKTFGKGTIQEPKQINGGAGLHITIARWLTPNGEWVNENGLKPDIEVKDDENTKEDEQLLKAIEVLKN